MATLHPEEFVTAPTNGDGTAGSVAQAIDPGPAIGDPSAAHVRRLSPAQWGLDGRAATAALIAAIGAMPFVVPMPQPAMETPIQGGAMLLIFIGLWLIRATPDYLAAILFFGAVPALSLAPPDIVFSGFRAGAVWLILAGFIIGGTIETTGLGTRVANWTVARSARSYATLVTSTVVIAALMAFLAPSAIARVLMLIPIVAALCERLGFAPGSNGRSGLMLAASLGTLIPCYAVLPASAPNLVMLGTAERVFGVHIGYGKYLAINYPVLGIFSVVGLSFLICRLLPAELRIDTHMPAARAMSGRERLLLGILAAALILWVTDFWHGVSPAWVALGAAALCLAPGIGPGRDVPLTQSVNLGLWLFIAAVIGAGAVVAHTGFGDLTGRWLVEIADLAPGNTIRNYYAVVLIGMALTAVVTTLGAPAALTPLANVLSEATGWSLTTVLMLQVPTWMFFALPYQLPVLLPVLAMGGVRIGQSLRVLGMFTLFGVLFALPLHFMWLVTLGYLE